MASNKRRVSSVDDNISEPPTKRRLISHDLPYPSTSTSVRPVPLQQPLPLLTFSYTPSRTLEFTDSALRYYVDPPGGAELRYGYERWVKRPEEKGRIDGLLKAVHRIRTRMDESGTDGSRWLRDIGVVSWRGVMTKILTAPYEDRDGWEMNVMDKRVTWHPIIVCKRTMDTPSSPGALRRLQDAKNNWTGILMGGAATWTPMYNGAVSSRPNWVILGWLLEERLIVSEVRDCSLKALRNLSGLVDSYVLYLIRGPHDEANFERKLLKFYFQSFLLGVPEIIVGFRTRSGVLTTIQSFKTVQIPRLVRGKPHAWDPLICLDWGHQLLTFLKSVVRPADSDLSAETEGQGTKRKVWRVKFVPRVGVSVSLLDDAGVCEVEAGEDRVGFLPKWYLDIQEKDGVRHGEREQEQMQIVPPLSRRSPDSHNLPPGWQI